MADSLRGGIVINEILAHPNTSSTSGFDTNGDGNFDSKDEFVELLNTSASAIDISGLQLWDQGKGNWFTFPAGTILQPGARAMVMTGSAGSPLTGEPGDLFFYAGLGSPVINNGGDNVVLLDPAPSKQYIAARFNGDALDNPTSSYSGFPTDATQVGSGEDFGTAPPGKSVGRTVNDIDKFKVVTPTPGTANICFTAGTFFRTRQGDTCVEKLRPGDFVETHDGRFVQIRWIWAQRWLARDLQSDHKLWPIKVSRNAFGSGIPDRDIYVSQHHRLLVTSKIAKRMFNHTEVLVPAKDLLDIDGVELVQTCDTLTYYHILCDAHEVLLANGTPAESLFLGPEALKSLSIEALNEICRVFKTTQEELADIYQCSRWHFASGKKARKLAKRHEQNAMPVQGNFCVACDHSEAVSIR